MQFVYTYDKLLLKIISFKIANMALDKKLIHQNTLKSYSYKSIPEK